MKILTHKHDVAKERLKERLALDSVTALQLTYGLAVLRRDMLQ